MSGSCHERHPTKNSFAKFIVFGLVRLTVDLEKFAIAVVVAFLVNLVQKGHPANEAHAFRATEVIRRSGRDTISSRVSSVLFLHEPAGR